MDIVRTELANLLLQKSTTVSQQTLKKYRQQYNYLTKQIGSDGDWMRASTENALFIELKNLELSASGTSNYLNIMFLVRDGLPNTKLLKYRDLLIKQREKDTKEKIIEKKALPSYQEVETYINTLYKNKDYVNYLVNEFIFRYGLRNKDINCRIISNIEYKELVKKSPDVERSNNWLILYKRYTTLVINQYKTVASYGEKTIQIRSRKVFNAANNLEQKRLLQKKNGDAVDDTELGYYINLYRTDDVTLTESDYFRINLNYLQSQPNSFTKIASICKTRGTQNITTLDNHYNINK